MSTEIQKFNPGEYLMNVGTKNKPRMYLEVKWRLVWLREQCPEATIETELVHLDLDKEVSAETKEWDDNLGKMVKVTKHGVGLAIYKATVRLPNGASATGTKMENAASFNDYLEKAETGAIGRALAGLGYGTQFTGDELEEGNRLADAPVQRQAPPQTAQQAKRDATIKAADDALYKAALQAKKRAQAMGHDDTKWLAMLQSLGIEQFASGADIAKVNGKLTEIEKKPKAS